MAGYPKRCAREHGDFVSLASIFRATSKLEVTLCR